ncbi:MAG: hypothetical protein A4E71_00218 [Smithella sp. PtaU1.Bin162]|nr:MAG: hypothetical protein A4E71_00218 [Smithella sp. PtaU1.Bin162]
MPFSKRKLKSNGEHRDHMREDNKYKIRNKILIESDLFYSPAFNKLSKSGIITLLRCLQKRKWETTKLRGKKQTVYAKEGFIFPYAEAAFLGVKTTQHWKNIRQLIEIGFLDLVYQGGWYQKHDREKDYSVYQLSERWRKYNTPEFIKIEKTKVLPDSFRINAHIRGQKLKVTSQKRRCQLHESESDKHKSADSRLHKNEGDETDTISLQSLANAT